MAVVNVYSSGIRLEGGHEDQATLLSTEGLLECIPCSVSIPA